MAGALSIFRALIRFGVFRGIPGYGLGGALAAVLIASSGFASEVPVPESSKERILHGDPVISVLPPERTSGRGFKIVYSADASVDVFWRYKTHFDNPLLLSNKSIVSHRLVSREGNVVITETEYANKSNVVFKWQTTLFPDQNLLKYVLLNPEECGQDYHYGYVQLEALDFGTRVTQVAYFDFFGVSLWVNYPFKGGMSKFLQYTAQWEQQFISEYKHQYKD